LLISQRVILLRECSISCIFENGCTLISCSTRLFVNSDANAPDDRSVFAKQIFSGCLEWRRLRPSALIGRRCFRPRLVICPHLLL